MKNFENNVNRELALAEYLIENKEIQGAYIFLQKVEKIYKTSDFENISLIKYTHYKAFKKLKNKLNIVMILEINRITNRKKK